MKATISLHWETRIADPVSLKTLQPDSGFKAQILFKDIMHCSFPNPRRRTGSGAPGFGNRKGIRNLYPFPF